MNQLSGADISSYQGNVDWNTFKNNVNFCLIKSSEGVGLIDPWFGNNRQQARNANILRGFYHFARPDLNSATDEAKFFIDLMNGDPLQEGEIIALDFEVQYNGDRVSWVKAWMDTVKQALGVVPIFYSYQSMLTGNDWLSLISDGVGLWVADPTNDPANQTFVTGQWPFAAFWQWGNQVIPGIQGPTDSDLFFGDAIAFQAYGYRKPTVPPTPPPVPPVPLPVPPTPTPDPCDQKIADLTQQLTTLQKQYADFQTKSALAVATQAQDCQDKLKAQSDTLTTQCSTEKEALTKTITDLQSTSPQPKSALGKLFYNIGLSLG